MKKLIELGFSGEYSYPPYQKYGPGIRECYIIHYVISGKGYFTASGKTHEIGAGQAFIIYKGERVEYHADRLDPWHYVWIDFSGELCETILSKTGFSPELRVSPALDSALILPYFKAFKNIAEADARELFGISALMGLIAEIARVFPSIAKDDGSDDIATRAMKLIRSNYISSECRVEKIAELLGVSRSQLYRLFKDKFGTAPKAYIDSLRIDFAKSLLENTDASVSEVSYSAGFQDPLYFSAAFRKSVGVSPSSYRNK